MQGKYTNPLRYLAVKAQRAVLRRMIAPLVSWQPLSDPQPGCTVLIGAHGDLPQLVPANLQCLSKLNLRSVRQIIVVLDRPRSEMSVDVEADCRVRFPELPLTFCYYTAQQRRVTQRIGWGWVNSWLSWSIGISQTRTAHAMLHDFDAMLLAPDFIEQRYTQALDKGATYFGVRWYEGNGVLPSDELATTFELIFDVTHVRRTHRPLDLFNHVCMHRGRSVDFDTFLYAQSRAGSHAVAPAQMRDMVHPSQMICQYVMLQQNDRRLPAQFNNLALLPHFMSIGGYEQLLRDLTPRLQQTGHLPLGGRELNVKQLHRRHLDWVLKQARHLEQAQFGAIRPVAAAYFEALDALVPPLSEAPAAPETGVTPAAAQLAPQPTA